MTSMNRARLARVIKGPVTTEKTARILEKSNIVTFWVDPKADKPAIKAAVELLLNVPVLSVRTTMVRSEGTLFHRMPSKRGLRKKAYVRLPAGAELDLSFGHAEQEKE